MTQVSLAEAQSRLPDLVLAAVRGEEVLIGEPDAPTVKLVPVSCQKPRPQFGSARGKIFMADDFDAPVSDFAEYMP
jgi:antitoxin (DNA-binding transcriptional repressor) of toxin-antitoxin stability system